MGKKRDEEMEERIVLYDHPIGKEMGYIHLVIAAPYDPERPDMVTLILTSEYSIDQGVVFTVDLYTDDYNDMCEECEVETLEGCILSTFSDDIRIEEVPEEPPSRRPGIKTKSKVRVLGTPNMWRHKWGRCCCVQRGKKSIAVTGDAIAEGTVPWWQSPYTPFELDLIEAATNPDKAMHVLLDDEVICGQCGQPVWVVHPEDPPKYLPQPPLYTEVEDPLCDDEQALEEIVWTSKRDAWELFYEDDHNHSIIQKSKLAVERANKRKRYSQEKLFEPFNRAHKQGHNIYTVRQAFYAALGQSKTGTWADFDLKMLRMIKGLEQVDLPAEILDMVHLDDEEAEQGILDKTQKRAVKAVIDHDATILEFLLDEEASHDDDDDGAEPVIVDDDLKLAPEVMEPIRQDTRPKAMPRVKRSPKPPPERPGKKRAPSKAKKAAAKGDLIAACKLLQESLASFIEVLEDEGHDPPTDETANVK